MNSTPVGQYHYDAQRDLDAAIDEMDRVASVIGTPCGSISSHPRHVMLGVDGEEYGRYRHEFRPSPRHNREHGHLESVVRALFQRTRVMMETLDLETGCEVTVSPSHAESHPLGSRAIPHYFDPEALQDLWHPAPRGVDGTVWRYDRPEDLDRDYGRCSLLRIEGHIGETAASARSFIEGLRGTHNLEFDLLLSSLDDPDATTTEPGKSPGQLRQDRYGNRKKIESTLRKPFKEVQASFPWEGLVLAAQEAKEYVDEIRRLDEEIRTARRNWATERSRRKLHCDVASLAAGYRDMRNEIHGSVLALLAALERIEQALPRPQELAEIPVPSVDPEGMAAILFERALTAQSTGVPLDADLKGITENALESPAVWAPAHMLALAWHWSVSGLRHRLREMLECLPRDLAAFEASPLLKAWKVSVADTLHLWLTWRVLAQVGELDPLGAGILPAERSSLADDLQRYAGNRTPLGLAAVEAAYGEIRASDPTYFANLVERVDGLEHLAGVEKGGTFVLVTEGRGQGSRVVADFSLSRRIPCCCPSKPETASLDPVTVPEYRIVRLMRDPETESFEKVVLDVPVLTNDLQPDFDRDGDEIEMSVSLPHETSVFGGKLQLLDAKAGVVKYIHEAPIPWLIDRFTYRMHDHAQCENDDCRGSDTGQVLVLMVPPVQKPPTGTITAIVTLDGQEADDVDVTLTGPVSDKALSGGDGVAVFPSLPPGTYQLLASRDNWRSPVVDVALGEGESVSVKLPLSPIPQDTGILTGYVHVGDAPVPGARVDLAGPETVNLYTDAGGKFGRTVVAGDYSVTVTGAGQEQSLDVRVLAGQTKHIDVDLKKPVLGGALVVTVLDTNGEPLPGSRALAGNLSLDVKRESAAPDSAGRHTFTDLPPGTYVVGAGATGRLPGKVEGVEVKAGETAACELRLATGPRLSATIVSVYSEREGVSKTEAKRNILEVYGERNATWEKALAVAKAEDPGIAILGSYKAAQAFLTDTLTSPDANESAVIASYEAVTAKIVKALPVASPSRREAMREVLAAMTCAYLDRLALGTAKTAGQRARKAAEKVALLMKHPKVRIEDLKTKWKGGQLDARLGTCGGQVFGGSLA
jgi:hypothetical protein